MDFQLLRFPVDCRASFSIPISQNLNHNYSAALDDVKLKAGQFANYIMLFRTRVIISSKHLAKIQKREFTMKQVVYGGLR
jgi:hypothetical protein